MGQFHPLLNNSSNAALKLAKNIDKTQVNPTTLRVLKVALSFSDNPTGDNIYASQKAMAERADCSIITIKRHMKILLDDNLLYLEKTYNHNPYKPEPNTYSVNLDLLMSLSEEGLQIKRKQYEIEQIRRKRLFAVKVLSIQEAKDRLRERAKRPVDNSRFKHLKGQSKVSLDTEQGISQRHNLILPLITPSTNTVGISKSVDNSPRDYPPKKPIYRKPNTLRRPYRHEVRENISKIVDNFVERGVAQEHTIPIVGKPCDTIDLGSHPNDQILDALKTVLAGKEGEPSFIAATRYLDSLQPSRMAA